MLYYKMTKLHKYLLLTCIVFTIFQEEAHTHTERERERESRKLSHSVRERNYPRRLVRCFGLSGLLRQYFSLYRIGSQREAGREK